MKRNIAPVQLSRRGALSQGLLPNVYGSKLWTSSDFWLLFIILSLRTLVCVHVQTLILTFLSQRNWFDVYVPYYSL